ncbi:MAG: SIMPL domain-containing protein [Pseudomonadota bacterium]|nr:SIMPL domain-containing protein [Pseudomonadota bacterium]
MIRHSALLTLAALAALALPAAAAAQANPMPPPSVQGIDGTRLDVVAVGEVTRVPDIARISAGVITQAPTATEALRLNAARMAAVREALRRAGIADRDIQTSNINLHPEYRYAENQPPRLIGYRAGNEVSIRFRDIAETGRILDALVAQGANQISGPMLEIDRPEAALDEARTVAIANARARAELYARALGMQVRRVLAVSEAGPPQVPFPRPMAEARSAMAQDVRIDPGEQRLAVSLTVTFELQ